MSDDLRQAIYLNFNRRGTEELLEIWCAHDQDQWSETTFDVIRDILQERQVELPPQNEPICEGQELQSAPPLSFTDDLPPSETAPLEDISQSGESAPSPLHWPERPWLSIWTAPRGTIRAILNSDPARYVLLLAAISGIAQSLDQASTRSTGDSLPIWAILLLAIVLGPLGGIIGLYIQGAICRWTGSLFGGQATSSEVRAAIAWSAVPQIAAMVLWLPYFGLYGNEMFLSAAPRVARNPVPGTLLGVLDIILGLWALFLLIKTVAEAHQFSAWRAIAALALPAIVLVVVIGGCALVFALLSRGGI